MTAFRALGNLLRAPAYRWIALLLFFSGITASFAAPTYALFATSQLHASELQITTFFAANALVGIFVVMLLGRWSDRLGQRRFYIAAGFVWLALGYVVLANATEFITMSLVGMIFFSALEISNVQLHALAKETTDQTSAARGLESSLTGTLRASYVCGWVLGPAVGGTLLLWLGNRKIFLLAAALYVGCATVATALLPRRRVLARGKTNGGPDNWRGILTRERRALLVFGVAVALTLGGDVLRLALLPVLMSKTLLVDSRAANLTFSIAPFAQMLLMPVVGYLADRHGSGKIVVIGALVGAVYYGSLACVNSIWQVYCLQPLYAFLIASIIGVGISHAQKLAHGEPGLATSVYFCAKLIAVVVGSMLSGLVAERFGVALSFVVPALMCVAGAALTLFVLAPRRSPAPALYTEATVKG